MTRGACLRVGRSAQSYKSVYSKWSRRRGSLSSGNCMALLTGYTDLKVPVKIGDINAQLHTARANRNTVSVISAGSVSPCACHAAHHGLGHHGRPAWATYCTALAV